MTSPQLSLNVSKCSSIIRNYDTISEIFVSPQIEEKVWHSSSHESDRNAIRIGIAKLVKARRKWVSFHWNRSAIELAKIIEKRLYFDASSMDE